MPTPLPSLKRLSQISCRLAQPDEGDLVQYLVEHGGGPSLEWVDWHDVYPYWLIGDVEGVPSGCIMTHPGKPFGRVEMLCILPGLTHRQHGLLVRELCYAAFASCKALGSQAVLSLVSEHDTSWLNVARHRDAFPFDKGTVLLKRI